MRTSNRLALTITTSVVALLSGYGCSSEPEGGGNGPPMFGQGQGGGAGAGVGNVPGAAGNLGGVPGGGGQGQVPGGEGQAGNLGVAQGGSTGVGTAGAGGIVTEMPTEGPAGGFFSNGAWQGYVWTTTEVPSVGTTLSPTTFEGVATGDPFCIQGTVAPEPAYQGFAMLGFNINQATAAEVEGTEPPILATTPNMALPGAGIAITSTQTGTFELRIQIQGPPDAQGLPQGTWCAAVEASAPRDAQGRTHVPFTSFNTECYAAVINPALNYQGQPIAAVTFQVPGSNITPTPYQFCIAGFGEGDDPTDAPAQVSVPLSGTLGALPGERLARVKVLQDGESYIVANNAWGNASSDGSQVIRYDGTTAGFTIIRQNANGGNQPVSFPAVYIGANGFQGTNGRFTTRSTDNLPLRVDQIASLQTRFAHNLTQGDANAAYDVWFLRNVPAGEYDGTRSIDGAFLMVWTYRPGNRNPIQSGPPQQAQVAGRTWNLYVGPRGNESEFPNTPVISYVNEGAALTDFQFDLKAFMNDAVTRSQQGQLGGFQFTNDLVLTDVFAGFEIWSGGTDLRVDAFSAVVTPN